MRPLTITLVLLALAVAPTAAAQTFTVSITDAPAGFPAMSSNATSTAAFKVQVTMEGTTCPTGGTITVDLAATANSPAAFFTVAPEPAQLTIDVPQGGVYTGSGGPTFTATADAALVANTTVVTDNATIPVDVVATATPPEGCQPALQPATSEVATITANVTAPPPPPAQEPVPEEKGFLPGFGAVHGTLAALAAVAMRRAHRRGRA